PLRFPQPDFVSARTPLLPPARSSRALIPTPDSPRRDTHAAQRAASGLRFALRAGRRRRPAGPGRAPPAGPPRRPVLALPPVPDRSAGAGRVRRAGGGLVPALVAGPLGPGGRHRAARPGPDGGVAGRGRGLRRRGGSPQAPGRRPAARRLLPAGRRAPPP